MKIGIYGGSFNPVHFGHLGLVQWIINHTDLDEIWMLVSPNNPLKDSKILRSETERLRGLQEALKDLHDERIKASDFEFSLPRPSYTAATLKKLREQYPEHEFVLIIGEDNWDIFDQWRDYEDILAKHTIYIYPRHRLSAQRFNSSLHTTVFLKDAPYFDISSTQMRNMKKGLLFVLLGLVMMACQGTKKGDVTDKALCPVAEWDQATAILMHTPEMELFDGVIHPTAGLFEHYFNVDSAAAEHRNYISLLRKNGIQVYLVEDILRQMDIDALRALAAQVLTYDTSALNADDEQEVGENYRRLTLSQMSREDMIRCLLLQPTIHLKKTDNNTGYEATYEHNPLMNLYFTRDQSITTPKGQVICKMNSSQRAPETRILRACYEALGIQPIYEIEDEGRMEGGDYIPAGTVAFIGCGMRTNQTAIDQMLAHDVFGHDTVIVPKQHCRWQLEMHLDTYFNIIDKDLCTMVARRKNAPQGDPYYISADIYVRAPGQKAYRLAAQEVDFVELLQERGFTIIPIEEEDELHYANNYLTIAPRHIMAVGGQSEEYQKALQEHGVTVEWVPLESLIDGYGAAHCMTQVLQRCRVIF